eukprot:m.146206 g.146206  ORF g.146206 m.146206 type:complete len:558 (+) comp17763_c0_seq2:299-1972(+)
MFRSDMLNHPILRQLPIFTALLALRHEQVSAEAVDGIDLQSTLVWGSGVTTFATTPARYVHVAAVDSDGHNITSSLGSKFFRVKVVLTLQNGKKSELRAKEFDRGDGTYSFQYFFSPGISVKTITVSVIATYITGPGHVGASPYVLNGPIPGENCNCPRRPSLFVNDFQCKGSDPAGQIDRDMALFPNGITREDIDNAIPVLNANGTSLIHFAIINNKVYSRNYGRYGGFQKFFNEMLFTLMRKVRVPDVEFLLNMGDWPQAPRVDATTGAALPPLPLFSWCGSDTHYDMVLPTYKIVQATVFGKDLENVQTTDGESYEVGGGWHSKRDKVYFRGRPSNAVRTEVAVRSRARQEAYDIAITKNHFNYFPDDAARLEHKAYEKKYGAKNDREQFAVAFKNKYQLNIDGTVAAYRLPALLAGNSVVLKQESDYYEHFYKAMKPWVHYVPVDRTLSDLDERYQWLQENDEAAEAIGRQGRLLARNHLRVEDVYCYYFLALERLADMQLFHPKKHPNMELQVDGDATTCKCPSASRKGKPRPRSKQRNTVGTSQPPPRAEL